jgi:effector-binding domain-containing protein
MKTIIIIISIVVIWSAFGYFTSRVEQAEYKVISKTDSYEIRLYPKHIVAQTTVEGDYRSGMSSGFRIVANYIFGGNTAQQPIAMTAPVVSTNTGATKGASIAMTAPVVINENAGNQTVSFGMPKGYTLETLPIPNDNRVKLVEVPERTVAAARFWGFRNERTISKASAKLISSLKKDNIKTLGSVSYAGYSGPGTPPWMVRNEVLIEVVQ